MTTVQGNPVINQAKMQAQNLQNGPTGFKRFFSKISESANVYMREGRMKKLVSGKSERKQNILFNRIVNKGDVTLDEALTLYASGNITNKAVLSNLVEKLSVLSEQDIFEVLSEFPISGNVDKLVEKIVDVPTAKALLAAKNGELMEFSIGSFSTLLGRMTLNDNIDLMFASNSPGFQMLIAQNIASGEFGSKDSSSVFSYAMNSGLSPAYEVMLYLARDVITPGTARGILDKNPLLPSIIPDAAAFIYTKAIPVPAAGQTKETLKYYDFLGRSVDYIVANENKISSANRELLKNLRSERINAWAPKTAQAST